jgi:pyruvate-formate lyase-activating enzyme
MSSPLLVVSNCNGDIFEVPGLHMTGDSLRSAVVPDAGSIVALPAGSVLFSLPRRLARGWDPVRKQFVTIKEFNGAPVLAAAAFMPPGYIRTLHCSYEEQTGAPRLPLYCYAAVGWSRGGFVAAGVRIDRQRRHELTDVDFCAVQKTARSMVRRWPQNRLVAHLVNNCALTYKCPNACNFVLGRWECPIPVSSVCNAACLGCISKQPQSSGFPPSQHRIGFTPTPAEIAEYVVPHLKSASHPIASFGQGCEGEPLIQADLVEAAIREIRARTRRGIININTNASKPAAVERLCRAGLGSMRVSLNSAQPDFYTRYYRPRQYSFDDVRESMLIARRHKVWVSVNYLVFPGFTDTPAEMRALGKLIRTTRLDMIQTRNLNVDPQWFKRSLDLMKTKERPVGMVSWIDSVKEDHSGVALGYFNPTGRTIREKAGT